ncbi:polyhydroxyalkanoate depolymerase [Fodinicurvata sediminis]|uniref:polyhydroxyalkanoate depolymerase n=1 Tax=Fodinicurvata sediminis TaxID=1121832 RepID=UPI0003B7A084|nr:polyhydroxyalkanoate depolymerase [Fodinicurvata sediminis]
MLYRLYEFQQTALLPWRLAGEVTRELLSNPFLPASYTHAGKSMVAGLEIFDDAVRQRPRPDWRIESVTVEGQKHRVHRECILDRPFCHLQRFRREDADDGELPKVLLVAPLSGHYATLLRGTVQALVADHEVYVTDWRDAREVPLDAGDFGFDDYLDELMGFMRHLGRDNHVIAVCQPAPLVLAAVAVMAAQNDPAQPRTMTLMGGPVDTRAEPTQVTRFAESKSLSWFERTLVTEVPSYYPGAGRLVYPGFMQLSGFISMNPSRHFDAHLQMFRHLVRGDGDSAAAHRAFYDEYQAVMDTPGRYYLETVDQIFQRHLLPKGELEWQGQKVNPGKIHKTALLTVEGELDDISAPGQTLAAHDLCTSLPAEQQETYMQKGVGHYGIFNGRRWREQIKPRIADFIRRHASD